jgi:hypothetical protein
MGEREDSRGMTFARPKKRGGQRAKLSTRMDSAWDKAVVLVKNGGSDGVGGRLAEWLPRNFLFSPCS